MKVKLLLFVGISFLSYPCQSWAQFYTIKRDNETEKNVMNKPDSRTKKGEEDFFYAYQDSMKVRSKEDKADIEFTDFFSTTEGHEISIEKDIPVFVNVKDSMLFGLIKERMDVCLPLDFISVTSRYGIRTDPFKKCSTFHDGIDLECNMSHVYSMLPGRVVKVVYSKKGYGNHIIIDHGHIQCLYGHLAAITVREGDDVYAGTIVAISGNTGKSTGPHLHIKISANGKSLNPTPFIAYLNKYITGLRDKIAYLRFGTRPPKELNINNLYQALDRYGVAFPKIVVAQALLETGYFTSNVCLNYNNLFGLRRPSDGSYYRFANWEESVKAYKDYVQYKYKGGNYFRFLGHIGYAKDPKYLYKVKSISSSL
ncbi:peptidoglycan DD-metalloendopeptidase family protein [Prevotella ihumii]|uniref:peptidoglycan DD-metalloendopeptidase family protein n=1 Tax=Prevotella ihumii TaxID=1917878 RepID=UPI000980F6C8|nr:peptidoglycan DD-metalloendopeptidase family protein [Prevotella ihumii]